MAGRRDWMLALLLSLGVAGLTLLPYLAAARLAGGGFAGFLLNPVDGFSYLAKMRQGAEGSWLFTLPYASEPGAGAVLFVYYLLLGHVSRWSGLGLLTVYHAARVLAAFALFATAFGFSGVALGRQAARWPAFLLILFASGLGWLLMPGGVLAADLSIPESTPFQMAYASAHFPVAGACVLGGMSAVIAAVQDSGGPRRRWLLLAALCGAVLGAVQPFVLLPLAASLVVWLAWEFLRARRGGRPVGRIVRRCGPPAAALCAAAAPWIGYDAWATETDPLLRAWSQQNLTPSPAPILVAAGFGLVLLLAIERLVRGRLWRRPRTRLLLVWVVVGAVMLYAPFSLQRRLVLGLFFPLAGLAGLSLGAIGQERLRRLAVVAILILSVPSNLIVVGAGLIGVRQQLPDLVISPDEAAAFAWLDGHAPSGALVLASPRNGNRLPAFANVRVLYGHPFETPDSELLLSEVEALYAWLGPPEEGVDKLAEAGVTYVLYGPDERTLGVPTWLPALPLAHAEGDVRVYGPIAQ